MFIATVVGNTAGLIVVAMGTVAGTLNAMGWVAALIYLFGAVGSGYFLIARPTQRASHYVQILACRRRLDLPKVTR